MKKEIDMALRERVRWAINYAMKQYRLTNKTLAPLMGVTVATVNNYRTLKRTPKISFIRLFTIKHHIDLNWVLTGEGEPFLGASEDYPDVCGPEKAPLYNKDTADDSPPRSAASASKHGGGIDPALQAMSDIKDIFASHDPILVPAIQANINAFKRALLRERQVGQLIQENRDLKKRITRLETLCDEFKNQIELLKQENHPLHIEINRLKATYEGPSGGSGDLANTSEGQRAT